MDVPPWVLVVMAYEKRALFWFPVPADSQFSRTTAKQVMAALVALSLARHQHVMWGPLYNTIIITRVNESADATTRSADDEICNKTVCDVTSGTFGFFMTMHSPWIDLLVRVLAPCACLVAYNVMIVRKISREKYCAERLMEKVGIQPPSWFYTGVIELEATVRWTGSLTFLICINSLPLSFFYLLQPQCFVSLDKSGGQPDTTAYRYYHVAMHLRSTVLSRNTTTVDSTKRSNTKRVGSST